MPTFRITFFDKVTVDIGATNGTEAKAAARVKRGLTKSQCKITGVEQLADAPPLAPVGTRGDQ
jgi:hypothetical protein